MYSLDKQGQLRQIFIWRK